MIHMIYFPKGKSPRYDVKLDEIALILKNPDDLLWVSLENPDENELLAVLNDQFHFHPLAIEDCQSSGYQTPKVDDFGEYIFIIAYALQPLQESETHELDTLELDIFLGENYVVTNHRCPQMPPVDQVRSRLLRDERLHLNGSDFLCHAILDTLVDDYLPIFDKMYEEVDILEDLVLSDPNPKTLERLLDLKHSILSLRRILSPQREVINRLSRDEFPMIDRQSRIYFRDIYDHLVRLHENSDSIRDIVTGALDIYLSSTSNRLNQIMKALTIVSTIFLPLSFVAGVYGMNFKYMPELNWPLGYPLVWLAFIIIMVVMLIYFKRQKWF
jgi:magnesium transporter